MKNTFVDAGFNVTISVIARTYIGRRDTYTVDALFSIGALTEVRDTY